MISPTRRRGFTLLELVIVVAILMVVAAIATPNIVNAISAYRLRTSASGVAGLFQKTRMLAVDDDLWSTVAMASDRTYAWGDLWGDLNSLPNGTLDPGRESQLVAQMPRGIKIETAGPGDISGNLDFTPTAGLPSFNARGLPCTVNGATCKPQAGGSGYVCYLRQDRSLDTPGWAAVTVSPAGRIRVWIWNGSAWN